MKRLKRFFEELLYRVLSFLFNTPEGAVVVYVGTGITVILVIFGLLYLLGGRR